RSGSMPVAAGPLPIRFSTSATVSRPDRPTFAEQCLTVGPPRDRGWSGRARWARTSRTPSACTTCMATSGRGGATHTDTKEAGGCRGGGGGSWGGGGEHCRAATPLRRPPDDHRWNLGSRAALVVPEGGGSNAEPAAAPDHGGR